MFLNVGTSDGVKEIEAWFCKLRYGFREENSGFRYYFTEKRFMIKNS